MTYKAKYITDNGYHFLKLMLWKVYQGNKKLSWKALLTVNIRQKILDFRKLILTGKDKSLANTLK